MNAHIQVTKRNGGTEQFSLEKIHRVLEWATEGITGVSISEIELRANIQLYDEIPAYDIHELLIKSAAELISENTPNYQYVAARLVNYKLRKEVYGQYEPLLLEHIIEKNIELGVYDPDLLSTYSEEDLEELDSYIKHERDDLFTYVAMEQFRGKYLVQDRRKKIYYETPQILYMCVAMTLFQNETSDRLQWVKDFYDAVSTFQFSLPTPIMSGCRTPVRQFSSCVLIESDDTLDSINATASSIVRYVSKKAGIGVGATIRAVDSKVGDGSVTHTGIVPYLKYWQAAVKSCSQGGVRGGAATVWLQCFHPEIENILVLKNNKGIESERVRHIDYGIQFNKVFYERLIEGKDITLFSCDDAPELYDYFYSDQDKFREYYEMYERKRNVRKKKISAEHLFSLFLQERKDTGRIYFQNVDHANTHSPFNEKVAPIKMSNLCAEIDLPTKPLQSIDDEYDEGEIALCTLAAINWGMISKPSDFEKPCRIIIRALNHLLDYQDYPLAAARRSTMKYRPLGVGIINFAYFLAKRDLKYDEGAFDTVNEYAEAFSYYLIKASADMAVEFGAPEGMENSKWADGILPIDTYKRDVDELVSPELKMPWNALRRQILETGIMNMTTMALMPSETSSQIANATNGIDKPRAVVSIKESKDGVLPQVIPEPTHLKNKYDYLWSDPSQRGYLLISCILQKYIDQGISVNTTYNPKFFEDGKVSMQLMLEELLLLYKYGCKQGYYCNTLDKEDEVEVTVSDDELLEQEECESCVI